MNFYVRNNLIKKEFKSFLLEWKGEEKWKVRGYGQPYLEYDFKLNKLRFEFNEASSGANVVKVDLEYFTAEPNFDRKSVILVYKKGLVEISMVFQSIDTCTKFYTILQEYIVLSELSRTKDGRNDT